MPRENSQRIYVLADRLRRVLTARVNPRRRASTWILAVYYMQIICLWHPEGGNTDIDSLTDLALIGQLYHNDAELIWSTRNAILEVAAD